jgi:phage-related protein
MAFYAKHFIFDGVPSEFYGLQITCENLRRTAVEIVTPAGVDVKLYTQEVYHRPVPYLFGVQQTPILELDIDLNVPYEQSAQEAELASRWLYGRQTYKKLQICQPDMRNVYFNGIFVKPELQKAGNIIRGSGGTFTCDAPWAWEFPKTYTYNFTGYDMNETIAINNTSDNTFYTYPTIEITMNVFGGDVSIVNSAEPTRIFNFVGLDMNEVLTINNDLQTITSSENVLRLSNFINPSSWLRYVQGNNKLTISGNVKTIKLTHQNARKIAG